MLTMAIPPLKVIGVEPQSVDVLRQSLMSGSRVTIEEPGVDGIWVPQLGEEVRYVLTMAVVLTMRLLGAAARRGGAP